MPKSLGKDADKWAVVGLVHDLEAKSVAKKWKDKSFAAGVDRSVIDKGIQMLGIERNQIITDTIMGMRQVAEKIGL